MLGLSTPALIPRGKRCSNGLHAIQKNLQWTQTLQLQFDIQVLQFADKLPPWLRMELTSKSR